MLDCDDDPSESLSGVITGALIGTVMWLVLLTLIYVACSCGSSPHSAPMPIAPYSAEGML